MHTLTQLYLQMSDQRSPVKTEIRKVLYVSDDFLQVSYEHLLELDEIHSKSFICGEKKTTTRNILINSIQLVRFIYN